jgi:hypothetical protein
LSDLWHSILHFVVHLLDASHDEVAANGLQCVRRTRGTPASSGVCMYMNKSTCFSWTPLTVGLFVSAFRQSLKRCAARVRSRSTTISKVTGPPRWRQRWWSLSESRSLDGSAVPDSKRSLGSGEKQPRSLGHPVGISFSFPLVRWDFNLKRVRIEWKIRQIHRDYVVQQDRGGHPK